MTAPTNQFDESLLAAIGRRLRTVRMNRGLQQSELADRAKVSRNTVITLERTGHGTVSSMVSVARALGLDNDLRGLFETDAAAASESVQTRQRIRRSARADGVLATV